MKWLRVAVTQFKCRPRLPALVGRQQHAEATTPPKYNWIAKVITVGSWYHYTTVPCLQW
jgi:hypothetical protein